MRTRAIVFSGIDQAGVQEIEIPSPEAGEVLVEVVSTVISPGTELRCLKGTQAGLPNEPFVPGYAGAGTIIEAGAGAEPWLGKRVFVRSSARASVALNWGGHAAHAVGRPETMILLPDEIDLVEAPLSRLFSIALRGVLQSHPRIGDTVGVVGLGVIGQCSARLFQAAGCRVLGVDAIGERVEALRDAGVPAEKVDRLASETLLNRFPNGVDILVDATGSERVVNDAVNALKRKAWNDSATPSGQVVIQGSYARGSEFDYATFFLPEATVHFPRDCTSADMAIALDQMARGRVAYQDLLTWVGAPEEAPSIYRRLSDREPGLITGAFRWHE